MTKHNGLSSFASLAACSAGVLALCAACGSGLDTAKDTLSAFTTRPEAAAAPSPGPTPTPSPTATPAKR